MWFLGVFGQVFIANPVIIISKIGYGPDLQNKAFYYLWREGKTENNVEEDEKDKSGQLFRQLMVILSVREFVGVLNKKRQCFFNMFDTEMEFLEINLSPFYWRILKI